MNVSWWKLVQVATLSTNMDFDRDDFEAETCNVRNENLNISSIIEDLICKTDVRFISQQRDESDMDIDGKRAFATQLFNKSKYLFLVQFGRHMTDVHLEYFKQFEEHDEQSYEIKATLCNLRAGGTKVKNRRYEALRRLVNEGTYFSDVEMMKREPLLYEQLVGRYLSEDEERERDNNTENNTLVGILLGGIERDQVCTKMLAQIEDEIMEEQESDEDTSSVNLQDLKAFKSKWGEFDGTQDYTIGKKSLSLVKGNVFITAEERQLFRNEFVSIVHQNFLDGKDDFDYSAVDDNEDYDNVDILDHDAENTYFDSEEPEDVRMEMGPSKEESSEDELEIYMKALNQHPTVIGLSKDMEKL